MEEYLFASIISAILTNISNAALSERQADRNEQLMDKQNEYNLPVNQINRLKEAGINPASLSMGNGMQVNGNTSAAVNPYTVLSMLDPMSIASNSALSGAKANETNSLLEERRKNIAAETAKYEADIKFLGVNTLGQQIANDYAAALNEAAITKSYSEVGLNWFQCMELKQSVKNMQFELEKVLPQQVKESESREKLNVMDQQRVVALIQNIKADTELKDVQKDLTEMQAESEGVHASLMAQQIEQSAAATEQSEAFTDEIRKQVDFYLQTWDDQVSLIANQRKLSKKQVSWFIANQLLNGSKGTAAGAAAVGAGIRGAAAMTPAAAPVVVAGF